MRKTKNNLNAIENEIKKWLKRKNKGFNVLAKSLGTTRQTISNWVRNLI